MKRLQEKEEKSLTEPRKEIEKIQLTIKAGI